MKRALFSVLAAFLVFYFLGCGKKKETLEEMQAPMSIESLSMISTQSSGGAEAKGREEKAVSGKEINRQEQPREVPLLPQGPFHPTAIEIQQALQNAGYYKAAVDGKIGPITKKAIKDFQKANNLKVDGKVGPKTWEVLKNYYMPAAAEAAKE